MPANSKSRRIVRAMTYIAPSGDRLIEPPVAVLERILLGESDKYWRCGSGDASLGVAEHRGQQQMTILKYEPVLTFFLIEPHGFFFTYFQPTKSSAPDQFVPFAGGPCRPWVRHAIGGCDFYAPRACFVSRAFAWEVIQEFLRSRQRSHAVPWVDRFSLEFPNPAAGDKAPSKGDLA